MRRIKAAFDPHGILGPGIPVRPTERDRRPMNGAQALIRTLVDCGVDVCFMNPGTSEMHFVAALDDVPEMRAVLGLFEGVVTGAADGYGRMAGRPAATLLHLGPGLGNGIANLHNARRARTPLVNIVGDHATTHLRLRPPPDHGHREPGPPGLGVVPLARRRPTRWRPTPSTPWTAPAALPVRWPPWWCRPTCRGRRPAIPVVVRRVGRTPVARAPATVAVTTWSRARPRRCGRASRPSLLVGGGATRRTGA